MERRGPLQVAFPSFSNATSAALSVTCAGLEFVPSIKSPLRRTRRNSGHLRTLAPVAASVGRPRSPALLPTLRDRGRRVSGGTGGPTFARHPRDVPI
jgi:hypothetical protein